MAVSGAGTGAPAEGAEGAQEGAAQAPAGAGLPDGFAERFDRMATTFEGIPERLERLEQGAPPEQQQPQVPTTPDSRFLMDPESGMVLDRLTGEWHEDFPAEYGDYGDELTAEDVQQLVQDGINRGLAPMMRQQMLAQMAALEEAYPDLRDAKIAQEVKAEAQRLVQATMPGADAEAWKNPALIEKIYLARQAGERAEGEVPPNGEVPGLEDPAAATAAAKELEDEGDAIVNVSKKGSFFR